MPLTPVFDFSIIETLRPYHVAGADWHIDYSPLNQCDNRGCQDIAAMHAELEAAMESGQARQAVLAAKIAARPLTAKEEKTRRMQAAWDAKNA
jgi:hypothetical protein